MPIQVICPGCHKRFQVADQHAGKEGPCPQCKQPIKIPELGDEVVIHAPEHSGPKDAKGRSVLKTVKAKDAKFNPLVATGVGVVVLLILLAAFLLRGSDSANEYPILAGGAAILGPLLAWAGYSFLKDNELEPYSGAALWIRATICGLVYAAMWFVYMLIAGQLGGDNWQRDGLELFQMVVPAGAAIGIGTLAGYASLDLEPASAFMHCALFFAVTILLRVLMGLVAIPGIV